MKFPVRLAAWARVSQCHPAPSTVKSDTLDWFFHRAIRVSATDAEKIVGPAWRVDQTPNDVIPTLQSKLETVYALRMVDEKRWTPEQALEYIQYHQTTLATNGGSDFLLRNGRDSEQYVLKEYTKRCLAYFDPKTETMEPANGAFLTGFGGVVSASPDGIVRDKATGNILRFVEAKCPFKSLTFGVPVRYWLQMQQQTFCSDQNAPVAIVDYVAYKSAKPSSPGAGLFICRVARDKVFEGVYEDFVTKFHERCLLPVLEEAMDVAPRDWVPLEKPPEGASADFCRQAREKNGTPRFSRSKVSEFWDQSGVMNEYLGLRKMLRNEMYKIASSSEKPFDEESSMGTAFEELVDRSTSLRDPFILESDELRALRVKRDLERLAKEKASAQADAKEEKKIATELKRRKETRREELKQFILNPNKKQKT